MTDSRTNEDTDNHSHISPETPPQAELESQNNDRLNKALEYILSRRIWDEATADSSTAGLFEDIFADREHQINTFREELRFFDGKPLLFLGRARTGKSAVIRKLHNDINAGKLFRSPLKILHSIFLDFDHEGTPDYDDLLLRFAKVM
jgi:hypothetical protein